MPQTVTSWGAIRGHTAELGAIYRGLGAAANGRASCRPRLARLACRVAVSPWRELERWAGLRSCQAGKAQVGGAQITNPIVTGGPGGPAE
jgi:hypothetical protein